MGRRKSKRQAPTRKKNIEPLDTQFTCPFCNHEKSCEVKMCVHLELRGCNEACSFTSLEINHLLYFSNISFRDKPRKTARISCRVCLEDYQTSINLLSDPLDVYNDWIDACDAANWRSASVNNRTISQSAHYFLIKIFFNTNENQRINGSLSFLNEK